MKSTRVSGLSVLLAAAALATATIDGTALAAAKPAAAKLDVPGLAQLIDREIQRRLDEEGMKASPLADDAEFMRRAYLDIIGVIPPAEKVVAFLDSKEPDKRAKLIDELLADPLYGRHLADIWQDLLLPRNSDNRRLRPEPLVTWLTESFNSNKPWDRMVTELLTATGTQEENGATTFFIANPTPDKLNDTVCRVFLGVQLQCAQCHNHPFTSWKRTEYWGMAAFFTKVRTGNAKQAAKAATVGVSESTGGRPVRLPESALTVPPKFLGGEEPKIKTGDPYRPALATWLAAAENPYFAKAMVNRMWGQLFGRGLVNPVDNLHDENPASHPELFAELARQFAASDFDVKHLIRGICNSRAYQRSSRSAAVSAAGAGETQRSSRSAAVSAAGAGETPALPPAASESPLFSHMAIKPLTPEQLYDSLTAILGSSDRPAPRNRNAAAGRPGPPTTRAAFVAFFQSEEGADPTTYQSGIPQALRLMNSAQMNNGSALLNKAVKPDQTPAQNLERLYLATLSRRPTPAEIQRLTAYLQSDGGDARKAYGDVLWALLNSSEFTMNH